MNAPLQAVVSEDSTDGVIRVEMLACGHAHHTVIQCDRPARRRRCYKCLLAGFGAQEKAHPKVTVP